MKKIHYLLGMMLLMAGYATNASAQVSNDNDDQVYKVARPQSHDYVQGEVLLKLKDGQHANVRRTAGLASAGISSLDAVLKEYGVEDMEQLLPKAVVKGTPRRAKAFNGSTVEERDLTQLYKVTLSAEKQQETMQMVEKLKALSEVEFAEPNYKVYMMDANIAASFGTNPYNTQQWYLDNYGVKQLWNKPIINSTRPVIAIIDTGVDMTHPDIAPNLWTNTVEAEGESNYDNDGNGFAGDVHGWDFINNTPKVKDFNMHGTHVAGIAAAANNSIGIVGANPRALIMPVSVMQSDGTGDVATIVKGIDYAVDNGATVLNLSLGTYANSSAMRQALERAYQSAVIVAAAGNDGKCINSPHHPKPCYGAAPMFPAAYSFVLGVQATQSNGSLAGFSNYDDDGNTFSAVTTFQDPDGFNYELKAPGTDMLSTIPGGKYKVLNGTSMAAPLVAGAISALKMVKNYDSQEILWGDLLHTDNIAQAYAVTNRPAELDLMKIMYRERKELADETEEDYSNDGEIDAGETVSLYPVIRTTFGGASNIQMKLEMGELEDPNTVEILTPGWVDFGLHLDAYGRGVSLNPMQLRVASNVADNRHIKMKFTAKCDEVNTLFEGHFTLVISNGIKIGGMLDHDITLYPDKHYIINSSLAIPNGVTVTVMPGTTIKFKNNTGIACSGNLLLNGEPGNMITFENADLLSPLLQQFNFNSPVRYVKFKNLSFPGQSGVGSPFFTGQFDNCIFDNCQVGGNDCLFYYSTTLSKCNVNMNTTHMGVWINSTTISNTNITNNIASSQIISPFFYPVNEPSSLEGCNVLNNTDYGNNLFNVSAASNTPAIISFNNPSYFGTTKESIARQGIYDMYNPNWVGYTKIELSNMLLQPVAEAHGIVWKVCVNGKDAQDEYEDLDPLGVGKHKFEVYFNRPMNKEVAPEITFGVRDPWTQNVVAEDGSWNEEGTIYTAYKTINGRTKSDGINRIYVRGAEDNEYFEIPYEKTRFNFMINAAGSMATGFAGEGKMGRVELTWNNENNNFDDAMGFNVYRYQLDADNNEINNTRINQEIVDIETTDYTDYDVTPGETYYYMYKVLSTDLQEFDASNVVAVTPLTATLGDANGSGDVDVSDVITTVNYAAGMDPKPFIFEAADMNTDTQIDILDVIGIIQKILNPSAAPAMASVEATATYTVEDGILYVESPVALAGVQVLVNMDEQRDMTVAESLDGFEHTSAWLSDNDCLFLAFNMNGKTLPAGKNALLKIGNVDISTIRLSDVQGHNVQAMAGNTTGIDAMGSKVQQQGGVFNLKGQKVAGKATDLQKLPKGVYIINGEKVVK